MSGDRELQVKAPHPTAGWICVAPFPRPEDREALEHAGVSMAAMLMGGRVFDMSTGRPVCDGIQSGVLVEVGPFPDDSDREILAPFTQGATIYYSDGSTITIGAFVYLAAKSVIAWEEAPA